ncbi:uncharacterized protein LOC129289958 [Prosopis cineraria]|uniref:uncharacterized protein LOC129289958 n=1 Tax=Prosopis cineraria TaxID=364024 RepID=UPI0024106463|nr:uncharacterized protein LOC129289958 [Prosopis cineraria]
MKQHLAGILGNIISCKKVPRDVCHRMVQSLKEVSLANKRKLDDPDMLQEFVDNSECEKKCQLLIESHRATWKESGCTLMADGWTDKRLRILINFLVYSPVSLVFVKSVDASHIIKDAKNLFSLFCEVIEWVGPTNIVYVVTDNAANYIAAGRLIREKYNHIYWSPCAAHCLNLILKDIASMPYVADLATKASKITVFVYNHVAFLSWLRRRDGWIEIVRPVAIRFATTFITLKSLHEHKHGLQALVLDKHFHDNKLSRTKAGQLVGDIVLDKKFWDDCHQIVCLMGPLIKLVRIVDADEKPSLGYVYEGMQRAKNSIKNFFRRKKEQYKPYTSIIQARWDKHLKYDLHAATYFLNPAFIYDQGFIEKSRVTESMLDYFSIYKSTYKYSDMISEMQMYRKHQGSFSREKAHKVANEIQPGCERNWSLFERIHTKKRNRLEHERLNDLVFVNYNLRLLNRSKLKKVSYDPVDYESIDKLEYWIAEEVPTPNPDFTIEEIQNEDFLGGNACPFGSSLELRENEGCSSSFYIKALFGL